MEVSNVIGLTRELIGIVRENVPQFQSRVAGVSEFVALREVNAELGLPYCFIIPIGRKVIQNKEGNTSIQKVRFLFSTVIAVDNTPRNKNGRDLEAMEQVEYLFTRLAYCFVGLDPDSASRSSTIQFVEDFLDDMTHARLWWNAIWALDYYMDVSNPDLCPPDDEFTYTTLYSRGYINGLEPDEAETPVEAIGDYNTKDPDGLIQGGDGVVSQEDL